MKIHGFKYDCISACEAIGLAKCFEAYGNECPSEVIMEAGFNENSGYVYIALENGISIASCMGRDVEFIVNDFENSEEFFLSTFYEAEEKIQELCNL